MKLKNFQVILTIIVLITAMGIVGQSDFENEHAKSEKYCKMVNIWKQTNGNAGWPAYNGEEVCK